MATYKKRGGKANREAIKNTGKNHPSSTTGEVFGSLDKGAFRMEKWVQKRQKFILGIVMAFIVVGVGYFLYRNFNADPLSREAEKEMYFVRKFFQKATENKDISLKDSLYGVALKGDGDRYGLLDIIDKYSGTDTANEAKYCAGLSYLQLSDYANSMKYLSSFSSEDPILKPLALGAMGDAHCGENNDKKAVALYKKAAEFSDNSFTTPHFLMKAGLAAMRLEDYKQASGYFQKIKDRYPDSDENKKASILLAKTKHSK